MLRNIIFTVKEFNFFINVLISIQNCRYKISFTFDFEGYLLETKIQQIKD